MAVQDALLVWLLGVICGGVLAFVCLYAAAIFMARQWRRRGLW